MPLYVRTSGEACRVRIDGEMNIYNAGEIKEGLIKAVADARDIALDLSGVSAIDTAGLQVLLLARREAQRCEKPFRMALASPQVEAVIGLFDLRDFFGAERESA